MERQAARLFFFSSRKIRVGTEKGYFLLTREKSSPICPFLQANARVPHKPHAPGSRLPHARTRTPPQPLSSNPFRPPRPVLSLYNNDPLDSVDLYDPLGHRRLAQAEGAPGDATQLTSALAPGTYFVAVSGAGNRDFNPFLAGSGFPGSTGAYRLDMAA